ncbi:hypothetical protein, partial [Bradyrhizobium sp.]|uniref:hypothetical protein n=1 Tax=Bradyrhizobium sp. TaxID=376 RepID=UPI0039189D67
LVDRARPGTGREFTTSMGAKRTQNGCIQTNTIFSHHTARPASDTTRTHAAHATRRYRNSSAGMELIRQIWSILRIAALLPNFGRDRTASYPTKVE